MGLACHRRIGDLEAAADLAVVAVPAPAIESSLRELAARGFCHVLLPGSIGLDTPHRTALAQVLQHTGIRLIGPASLGIARPAARVNLTLSTSRILPGPLAIVSQSSAVCAALLDFAEGSGIGLSSVVSTGAVIDVDISDALDYLSFDSATRSIAVYIEGVRDARRLLSSLRAAARTKPIVVLKAGEHDIGERAVVTHSDALVSNQQTFQSAMRRCGVVMVDSFGELFSAVEWLANNRRVRGDRLAIVTNGGGLGTLAAGACRRYGVDLATLSDETIASLGASLPAEWSGGNPVNVMALATPQLIAASVRQVSQDPQADAVLAIFHTTQAADSASIANALLAQAPDAPTMYGFVGEADAQRGCAALNLQGHSVFKTPESAVRAFSVLVEYHRSQRNLMQAPPVRRASQRFDEARIEALLAAAIETGHGTVDQVRSLELLACCGIPVPQTFVARTAEDAARLADQIGYPVAMKIVSPDITHKSDIGGVRLDIRDRKELRAAAAGIRQRMRDNAPTARLEGLAIQPMIRRGHSFELLVGVGHDSVFGPVITFGAGGIAVEITADTAVGIPPLNGLLAHDLISRTRVSKLLAGYRHVPAARIDDIAEILVCRFRTGVPFSGDQGPGYQSPSGQCGRRAGVGCPDRAGPDKPSTRQPLSAPGDTSLSGRGGAEDHAGRLRAGPAATDKTGRRGNGGRVLRRTLRPGETVAIPPSDQVSEPGNDRALHPGGLRPRHGAGGDAHGGRRRQDTGPYRRRCALRPGCGCPALRICDRDQ